MQNNRPINPNAPRPAGAPGQPGQPPRPAGAPGQPGQPPRPAGAPGQPGQPPRPAGAPGQQGQPPRPAGMSGQPGQPPRPAPGQPAPAAAPNPAAGNPAPKPEGQPERPAGPVRKPKPKVDPKLAQPEIVSVLKLRRKKNKDLKLEKERLKRAGRIVSSRHLRMVRKGLEVPRYKVHPEYGLTNEIVEQRFDQGLSNDNVSTGSKSYKGIVLSNIFTFFNIITIALTVWLITVAAFTDLIFSLIVAANITLGIYQEVKAKKTMDELSIMSSPTGNVIREGVEQEVHVTDIVLDDVVVLDAGDQVIADCMLLDGVIEVNESMLTGESDAIVKQPGDLLYGGSFIVTGQAKAKIEQTGRDNFMEKLTNQVKKKKKTRSDLLSSLNIIMRVMSVVIVVVGALLFYVQFVNADDISLGDAFFDRDIVRTTAGAMAGMIPAGLFLVSSIALYIGVVKLSEFNVLVKELYCIEMLAKINVLCLDKTGTITDGTMVVKNIVEYNTVPGLTTKTVISAMLNALNDRNMTSKALEEKFGLAKRIPHVDIMPFNSIRKYSAVQFVKHGTFVLGAPEIVMKHRYNVLKKDVEKFSKEGYRVLLLAHSKAPIEDGKIDLFFFESISLILIEDNIRPDAIETIDYFKKSGVDVKVISGDNPMTVSMISERAGIDNASKYISLDGLDDDEVIRSASRYTVFGRVSPQQKKLLVKTLKEDGSIVAMTGDGVNDILALKEADVSIAVASGADAARSVSNLVLLDSNFSSMPRVVTEGRRVINNIAKVATLFLTKVIFALLLAIFAIQNQGFYPITPVQFLMIDVLVIFVPSAILILEPNNAKTEGNFLAKVLKTALPGAVTILIISMAVFSLSSVLALNLREVSTIIVIASTFAMMMVLYDISTPLNKTRKKLFQVVFSIFVFLTILFPRIFDFSPLTGIGGYHDRHLTTPSHIEWPVPRPQQINRIVVNNRITQYAFDVDDAHNDTPFVIYDEESGNWVIRAKGITMKTEILHLPQVFTNLIDDRQSPTFREQLVFDATLTDVVINGLSNSYVTIDHVGNVWLNIVHGNEFIESHRVEGLSVMPTVGISSDGRLVINGTRTDIPWNATIESTTLRYDVVEGRYRLFINNREVRPALGSLYSDYPLIDVPVLSRGNKEDSGPDVYAIGGYITSHIFHRDDNFELFFAPNGDIRLRYDGMQWTNQSTGVNYLPSVRATNPGYWQVFGMATFYTVSSDFTQTQLLYTNYREDRQFRLVIDGVQTHINLNVVYAQGGNVPQLPLPGMITLFFLSSLSLPLLRVVKATPPWVKGHVENIKKIVSKVD